MTVRDFVPTSLNAALPLSNSMKSSAVMIGMVLFASVAFLGGCQRTNQSPIIGHWIGRPLPASDESEAVVKMQFAPDQRFKLVLERPGEPPQESAGTWRVVASNGARQTVELASDADAQIVRLKLSLVDDGLIAHEENGDSRIGAVTYRRLGDSDSTLTPVGSQK